MPRAWSAPSPSAAPAAVPPQHRDRHHLDRWDPAGHRPPGGEAHHPGQARHLLDRLRPAGARRPARPGDGVRLRAPRAPLPAPAALADYACCSTTLAHPGAAGRRPTAALHQSPNAWSIAAPCSLTPCSPADQAPQRSRTQRGHADLQALDTAIAGRRQGSTGCWPSMPSWSRCSSPRAAPTRPSARPCRGSWPRAGSCSPTISPPASPPASSASTTPGQPPSAAVSRGAGPGHRGGRGPRRRGRRATARRDRPPPGRFPPRRTMRWMRPCGCCWSP
jgi:hypothetical protein